MIDPEVTRLSRLVALLTLLQTKRVVTATELAHRFSVSTRTIYRDIRTLESAGIPVVTLEGKGYAMLDGYRLPPVMFTRDEAIALRDHSPTYRRGYGQTACRTPPHRPRPS
jgi:predicted DNA-binding transcriptional regulator YafY